MNSSFKERFINGLAKFADLIGRNIYLLSLRDAFLLTFPLTMFSSILLVISNFPLLSPKIKDLLWGYVGHAVESTMLLMAIFVSIGIGYFLFKYKNPKSPSDAIYSGAVALSSFFIVTPFSTIVKGEEITGVIPMTLVGAQGLFVAIIISILSTTIYSFVVNKRWTIKMPKEVPSAISKSFSSIIPGSLTLLIFMLVSILFKHTDFASVHTFIYEFLQKPLIGLGTSFIATMFATFAVQFFWFFGIHGHLVVNPIMDTVWTVASLDNLAAYKAGLPLPHIVTKQFVEMFTVSIGGMGAISALIAVFIVSKVKQQREVAKLGFIPSVFNIMEPTMFGLPIMLNPIMAIPWMMGAPMMAAIAYGATVLEIMPRTTGVSVPWTMPMGIGGALATNSIMGGVVQIICFIACTCLWIPFILYSARQLERKREQEGLPQE